MLKRVFAFSPAEILMSIPVSPLWRANTDGSISISSAADTLVNESPPASPNITFQSCNHPDVIAAVRANPDVCTDCGCICYPECTYAIEDPSEHDSDDSDAYDARLQDAQLNAEACESCTFTYSGIHKTQAQMDYGLSEGEEPEDGECSDVSNEQSQLSPKRRSLRDAFKAYVAERAKKAKHD